MDLGVSGGREAGERLFMEATPLERKGLKEFRHLMGELNIRVIFSPAGTCEGESVAVGENLTKYGEDQEMA